MKIRERMVLGNMVVGILPVILAIVIFTIVISGNATEQAKNSLEDTLLEIKMQIDDSMSMYQTYSYFFANSVVQPPEYDAMQLVNGYNLSINVNNYGLKMLQFTYEDEIVYENFYGSADDTDISMYLTSDDFVDYMWEFMDKPMNKAIFKMYFAETVSNMTVVRNCAFVWDDEEDKKKGLSVVSVLLDNEFLYNLTKENPDLIIFTETKDNQFMFSDTSWDDETAGAQLRDAEIEYDTFDHIVNINGDKYYVAKMSLYETIATVRRGPATNDTEVDPREKVIADIGICYGFESVNKIMTVFQKVSIFVFLISIIVAAIIAIFISKQITVPVLNLKDMTHDFETKFTPIPGPENIRDEINMLQKSISDMSSAIITKTTEIQEKNEEISALVEQQNGDYFLTSLLIKPLVPNNVRSENVKVDFYVNQKKKFKFRKWKSQLGGDLCIAREIVLKGRKYFVFLNGDAMGKSMQGAGGALVMGVALNSFIDTTKNVEQEQNKTPGEWLEDCYNQMEGVFESFDGSMMMSCILGLIDEENGMVTYFNAEHPWLVLYRDGKAIFAEDESEVGKKLGTIGFSGVYVKTRQLSPGDVLLMGSDGKDDIKLGTDPETGLRIINEDETAFLKFTEEADGNLDGIADKILNSGELTDDFTMLRLSFLENPVARKVYEEKNGEKKEKLSGPEHQDAIKEGYNSAIKLFKSGAFEEAKNMMLDLYYTYEDISKNFNGLNLLGNIAYKLGENENALKFWQEAAKLEGSNKVLLHNISVVSKKLGL